VLWSILSWNALTYVSPQGRLTRSRGSNLIALFTRRTFIFTTATGIARSCLPASTIQKSANPRIEECDFSKIKGAFTANEEFFIRNHFTAPQLGARDWKLVVAGHVHSQIEVRHSALLRAPARAVNVTLECAGNGIGAGGISSARWKGVALSRLLRSASIRTGAKCVRLIGSDAGIQIGQASPVPFARAIPLDKALDANTIVAYEMNGVPLSMDHGYPARAIIPGWYAMDSVKWLTRIEVLNHEDSEYFMTHQYVANRLLSIGSEQRVITRMKVKSQISRPIEGERIFQGSYIIYGAAWAGDRNITKVEVSTDGGSSWRLAELRTPDSPYLWTLWQYEWKALSPGTYTVVARATDTSGETQPESRDVLRTDSYEINMEQRITCIVV
jgi:DMSO/TMAO reductase YedYZ molybdopterin-dependent catalytic subunit